VLEYDATSMSAWSLREVFDEDNDTLRALSLDCGESRRLTLVVLA
jgi:hypothetical protein